MGSTLDPAAGVSRGTGALAGWTFQDARHRLNEGHDAFSQEEIGEDECMRRAAAADVQRPFHSIRFFHQSVVSGQRSGSVPSQIIGFLYAGE